MLIIFFKPTKLMALMCLYLKFNRTTAKNYVLTLNMMLSLGTVLKVYINIF